MYVSILFVRMILSELRRRGIEDQVLLQGSSIDAATLANLRATISLEDYAALLMRAVEITGDQALGLSMGEHWSESMLQVVGQLLVACRTMRDAFTMFARYMPLIANNVQCSLEEQGDRAYLFFDSAVEHPVASRIGFEAMLGFTYRFGRRFARTGEETADEVWFRYPAPPYAEKYRRLFNCTVRFDQPRYAFVFAREYLDMPQVHGDETVREVLQTSAELLLRERESESVAERVRGILRYEEDLVGVDARRIANQLGMNVRALRRRLGSEGAPLGSLRDEARLRIARRELSKPGASIKEVAHGLGFSEASAFHRAFKRWSGQTPAQFIKEHGDASSMGPPHA